jgi:signal transduction histidine kinase
VATRTVEATGERPAQGRPLRELEEAVERLELERTELMRSRDAARFLARAAKVLTASLDYRDTLSAIARAAVPALADTCFVDILEDREQLKREEVAFSEDQERISVEQAGLRWPLPDAAGLPMQALKSGKALIVNADESAAGPPSGERGVAIVTTAAPNALCVPLTSRSRTFGVLTLLSSDPKRRYTNTDLEVATELAQQAAAALFNARLYQVSRSAIRAREDVLAMVSHDLRAPLQTIKLAAVAISKLSSPGGGGQRQLEAILRGIHRMERMVSDLLDLTSIEAGHLSVDRQGHEIYGLIRDAFEMLSPLARAKSIDLRVEVLTPPRSVLCDRERVLQVFSNLVGNAIKFTKEGGSVAIRAELQRNQACFAVRDNGPGIPETLRLHLFERYWQAEDASKKTGRGLGLYIAKGIVEAQGGRIWFDSELGAGSTFYFTLPLLPEDLSENLESSRAPNSESMRAGAAHPPTKHAPPSAP